MPGPALRSPSARARQVAREIDRDERVVLLVLGRRLAALLRAALDDRDAGRDAHRDDLPEQHEHHPEHHEQHADLSAALDAMAATLDRARAEARALNDARIARRAERPHSPGTVWLPPELRAHACHGDYLGAFADLAAVGRMAFHTCLMEPVPEDRPAPSPRDLALELHLRGALWTIEHAGRVHVFRCRGAQSGSQIER